MIKLHDFLLAEGYSHLRNIGTRGLCGLKRMAFTVGVFEGLNYEGYSGRWCFETFGEAETAILNLDDKEEPIGDWIKYKGARGEYPNPLLQNN